jgi:hypothetical protein
MKNPPTEKVIRIHRIFTGKITMDIYVFSRGLGLSSEYRWFQVTETGQERVNGLPSDFHEEATNLIYSESPSVVLSRKNGYLMLLITAIQPEDRKDFSNRQIRISTAWIVKTSLEYETAFCHLAANALDEREYPDFTKSIAEAVSVDNQDNVTGNFSQLSALVKPVKVISFTTFNPDEFNWRKVAKISTKMKALLAEELREFGIPDRDGVLVVATEIKKEETLKQAKVWRAMSSLIESEDWLVYDSNGSDHSKKNSDFNLKNKFLGCVSQLTQYGKDFVMGISESFVNKKLES